MPRTRRRHGLDEDDPLPIPEIAEALRVQMVMEGSVRYAEDRVLITAQLIDGRTGAHVWSNEYDRDLVDVFTVQAEIAANIAAALEAELLPDEQESIEKRPTESSGAYSAYLKALAIIGEGESAYGVAALPGSRSIIRSYLDEALELDPEFALAHAWQAYIYVQSRLFDPATPDTWLDRRSDLERLVSEHADRALALDPSIGIAYVARAYMHFTNWDGNLAQIEAEQALRLTPNDRMVLSISAILESFSRNRHDEATRHLRCAAELDPNNSVVFQVFGLTRTQPVDTPTQLKHRESV